MSGISGLDSLKHLMDENQMNPSDLARLLGLHVSMGSKILKGERSLTVEHLKKLSARFKVRPGAILVNPYDIEAVGDAIHEAVNVDRGERRRRMRKLRETIRKHDIYWWVDRFLEAAISRDLSHFPLLRDYVPIWTLERPATGAET